MKTYDLGDEFEGIIEMQGLSGRFIRLKDHIEEMKLLREKAISRCYPPHSSSFCNEGCHVSDRVSILTIIIEGEK